MKKGIGWAVALSSILGSCAWLAYVGSSAGPVYGARLAEWMPTLRVLFIGILCLVSTFVALRGRNWFAFLVHATVSLVGVWFVYLSAAGKPEEYSPFSNLPAPSCLVPAICLMIIPGVFWYITGRAGWPRLVLNPVPLGIKIGLPVALLVGTLIGAAALDFRIIWSGECHYSLQPFTTRLGPQQAVFTARILRARKLWGPDESQWSPGWRRYWLLASVQKQFWGLPWWDRKLVILLMSARASGAPPPRDEIDFVDGRRLPGSLTRFLPIYETFCTRTGPLADSEIDLRVLRDGPPQNGIRILGRTARLAGDYPNYRWETVPSVKVLIRGPAGEMIVESDANGVYDATGLPPGYYEVGREPAAGVAPSWRDIECHLKIAGGDIGECNVGVKGGGSVRSKLKCPVFVAHDMSGLTN